MFALDANTPNTAAPALIGADTGDFLPGFCTGKQGYTRKSYPGITAFLMFAADAVRNLLEVFAPLPGRIEEGTSRRLLHRSRRAGTPQHRAGRSRYPWGGAGPSRRITDKPKPKGNER